MKKILIIPFVIIAALFSASCGSKSNADSNGEDSVVVSVPDTTLYGVCGEGSMMHTLEVIKDDGSAVTLEMSEDGASEVLGGVFAGDRVAVTYCSVNNEKIVTKAINLTTLLGRWTSLDRNFTILEDGTVESNQQAESRPYTSWSIHNANLVLNADTFNVLSLGADSLLLESNDGVYSFKRQN